MSQEKYITQASLDFHVDVNRLVFTSHFLFSLVRLPHTIAAYFM